MRNFDRFQQGFPLQFAITTIERCVRIKLNQRRMI